MPGHAWNGRASLARVKLRNGAKPQGYVSSIYEESLTVTNFKTGVSYSHRNATIGSILVARRAGM